MPTRFTLTKVPEGVAKAVFNVFARAEECTSVRTLPSHKNKDGSVTQTFLIEMVEAKRYQERRERKPRDKSGWCYILRTNDVERLYKLGCSKDPQSRRATFKTNFPVRNDYEVLIQSDDMYALERYLHKLFAAKRVAGTEFFALDDNDLETVKGMTA